MSQSGRSDVRNTALSIEEFRRDRAEQTVSLRKVKKDQQLAKKRNLDPSDFENEDDLDANTSQIVNSLICNSDSAGLLENCCENMTSPGSTKESQKQSAQIVRQLMKMASVNSCDTDNVALTNRIATSRPLMEKLAKMLRQKGNEDNVTKAECARVFSTILSSASNIPGQMEMIDSVEVIDALIETTNFTESEVVVKNCITAIGNYIGDGIQRKINAIQKQVIPALLGTVRRFRLNISVLTPLSWVLANLCRNSHSDNMDLFSHLHASIMPLSYLILQNDDKIIENACYALEYLTGEDSYNAREGVEAIFQTGIGPRLVLLLNHENPWIIRRTLAVIGNILYLGEEEAQKLIEMGVVPQLVRLLESSNEQLVKEAAWSISNMSAGSQAQINCLFEIGVVPLLMKLIHSTTLLATKKEAVWALTHLARSENPAFIQVLFQNCMLQSFCHILSSSHNDLGLVKAVLKGLHRMLRQSEKIGDNELNLCRNIIEECGGVENVEKYEYHENDEVHYFSTRTLDFCRDEQDDSSTTDTDNDDSH